LPIGEIVVIASRTNLCSKLDYRQVLVILGAVGSPEFLSRVVTLLSVVLQLHVAFLLQHRRTININNRKTLFIPPFLPTQVAILIGPCSVFFASRALGLLSMIFPLEATLLACTGLNALEDGEKGEGTTRETEVRGMPWSG
jgi:hypothetical protein